MCDLNIFTCVCGTALLSRRPQRAPSPACEQAVAIHSSGLGGPAREALITKNVSSGCDSTRTSVRSPRNRDSTAEENNVLVQTVDNPADYGDPPVALEMRAG